MRSAATPSVASHSLRHHDHACRVRLVPALYSRVGGRQPPAFSSYTLTTYPIAPFSHHAKIRTKLTTRTNTTPEKVQRERKRETVDFFSFNGNNKNAPLSVRAPSLIAQNANFAVTLQNPGLDLQNQIPSDWFPQKAPEKNLTQGLTPFVSRRNRVRKHRTQRTTTGLSWRTWQRVSFSSRRSTDKQRLRLQQFPRPPSFSGGGGGGGTNNENVLHAPSRNTWICGVVHVLMYPHTAQG